MTSQHRCYVLARPRHHRQPLRRHSRPRRRNDRAPTTTTTTKRDQTTSTTSTTRLRRPQEVPRRRPHSPQRLPLLTFTDLPIFSAFVAQDGGRRRMGITRVRFQLRLVPKQRAATTGGRTAPGDILTSPHHHTSPKSGDGCSNGVTACQHASNNAVSRSATLPNLTRTIPDPGQNVTARRSRSRSRCRRDAAPTNRVTHPPGSADIVALHPPFEHLERRDQRRVRLTLTTYLEGRFGRTDLDESSIERNLDGSWPVRARRSGLACGDGRDRLAARRRPRHPLAGTARSHGCLARRGRCRAARGARGLGRPSPGARGL